MLGLFYLKLGEKSHASITEILLLKQVYICDWFSAVTYWCCTE